MTLEEWLAKVDEILLARTSLAHDDMEDWSWADAHEDGLTPEQAVEWFLEDIDLDF